MDDMNNPLWPGTRARVEPDDLTLVIVSGEGKRATSTRVKCDTAEGAIMIAGLINRARP